VLLLACAAQHRTNIDPGRIEERERSFGMFNWAPPAAPASSVDMTPAADLAALAPSASVVQVATIAPSAPAWSEGDLKRRATLAADWSAHAGPGITGVQTFGDGARGIVAFGDGCSDAWLDSNVAPIWGALKQHGFIAVHCQGPVQRFSWPQAH
jgi:hypothetical protein